VASFLIRAVAAFACLFASAAALAQMHGAHQPYAGMEARKVKALSDEQIADLKAGRGMGLALAAELNGYPGPSHVLKNAEALGLTDAQRQRTEALFASMKAEAVPLGERLIAQETELDRLFASKAVEPAKLTAATAAIGETQGALRAAHLRYHLTMMDVLTPEQVRRYGELRGYGPGNAQPQPHEKGHGGHAH
jgi:Spy/CpxP family protein refolding chaperone